MHCLCKKFRLNLHQKYGVRNYQKLAVKNSNALPENHTLENVRSAACIKTKK